MTLSPDLERVSCRQLFGHVKDHSAVCDRAAQLLWDHLSPEQKEEYCESKWFTIPRTAMLGSLLCHVRITNRPSCYLVRARGGDFVGHLDIREWHSSYDMLSEAYMHTLVGDWLLQMKLAAEADIKRFVYIGSHCGTLY